MLTEEIQIINRRLSDQYGKLNDQPNYRIVWAEDEFEKRLVYHTDEGFELLSPVIKEVPKYRHITGKHVLEKLFAVPEINRHELVTVLTYEPLWVFEDKLGNAVQPQWVGVAFVVNIVIENMRLAGSYVKYKEPIVNVEEEELRLKELQEALFPNETDVGDALSYREGISVPSSYKKVEIN